MKKHLIYIALILICGFSVYSRILSYGFVWDDVDLIVRNPYIQKPEFVSHLFSPIYWKTTHIFRITGMYRPMRSFAFALDYSIWGNNPFGFHLSSLILHLANGILIYLLAFSICRKRFSGKAQNSILPRDNFSGSRKLWKEAIPVFAALFFLLHPANVETVSWIKNRADILVLFFLLLSLLCFHHAAAGEKTSVKTAFTGIASGFFLLAVLSKETAFVFPAVLVLYAVFVLPKERRKEALSATLPFWLIAAGVFGFRLTYGLFPENHAQARPDRLITMAKTFGTYLQITVFPFPLNADHWYPDTPPWNFIQVFLCLVFAGLVLFGLINKEQNQGKTQVFFLFWFLLFLVPSLDPGMISGRKLAEQRLYIPVAGFSMFVFFFLAKAWMDAENRYFPKKYSRKTMQILAALALLLFPVMSGYSAMRTMVWKNEYTLFSDAVQKDPQNPRALKSLGYYFIQKEDYSRALSLYHKSISVYPDYAEALNDMGNLYTLLGKTEKAVHYYEKAAKSMEGGFPGALYNLGLLYDKTGLVEKSLHAYEKALEADPFSAGPRYALAVLLARTGRVEEAVKHLSLLTRIHPLHINALVSLAGMYTDMGLYNEALKLLNKALSINPKNADTWMNMGILFSKTQNPDAAISAYRKALDFHPESVGVLVNLGMVYMETGKKERAKALFEKAISIDPDCFRAHNNLGILLFEQGDIAVAKHHFKEAIRISPDYIKGYINLAEAERSTGRDEMANRLIETAIELAPDHPLLQKERMHLETSSSPGENGK